MTVAVYEVTILCEAKTADNHMVRGEMRIARALANNPGALEASAYVVLKGILGRSDVKSALLRETIRTLRIRTCARCGRREGDHRDDGRRSCPVGTGTWLEEAS